MNPDHLAELKTNEIVRKRLAKLMARDCFRNSTKLEDMHTADQIDDQEMQDLMIDVVDRCYDFLMELCSPQGAEIMEDLKQRDNPDVTMNQRAKPDRLSEHMSGVQTKNRSLISN